MQYELDLKQTVDVPAVKTHISALHKQLGYGKRGDHRGRSVRSHLRSESVGECDDKLLLLAYETYLEGQR